MDSGRKSGLGDTEPHPKPWGWAERGPGQVLLMANHQCPNEDVGKNCIFM
jgi:hypothetical protein